jgi:hypothetical protein
VSSVSALFTANYSQFLTATIALIGIIVLPALIIRGGLNKALSGIKKIFSGAR